MQISKNISQEFILLTHTETHNKTSHPYWILHYKQMGHFPFMVILRRMSVAECVKERMLLIGLVMNINSRISFGSGWKVFFFKALISRCKHNASVLLTWQQNACNKLKFVLFSIQQNKLLATCSGNVGTSAFLFFFKLEVLLGDIRSNLRNATFQTFARGCQQWDLAHGNTCMQLAGFVLCFWVENTHTHQNQWNYMRQSPKHCQQGVGKIHMG